MNRIIFNIFTFLLLVTCWSVAARGSSGHSKALQPGSDPDLKVWFSFDNYTKGSETISDVSGNNFTAALRDGAGISVNTFNEGLLNLGSTNGYLDLGEMIGSRLIGTLEDFTVSTYVFIAKEAVITNNGNFLFSFGNSDRMATDNNGCMFFSARSTRYAISKTNWTGENGVEMGSALEKGKWKHVALTYESATRTAKIFIDGTSVAKSVNISIAPKALGATAFNYIGKSSYALNGDAFLSKTLIDEFRIYTVALTDAQVAELSNELNELNVAVYQSQINDLLATLNIYEGQTVTSNLTLPVSGNGISLTWSSSAPAIISNTGVVLRPSAGSEAQTVYLTVTAVKEGAKVIKTYHLKVSPHYSDAEAVKLDADHLSLTGSIHDLRSNLALPVSGTEGSAIVWNSSMPDLLTNKGQLLSLPEKGTGKTKIVLTATLTKGASSQTRQFEVMVAEKEGMSAYLFAYFTGNTGNEEALRFAISRDGYTYKALNNNLPVLDSKVISSSGGIRDPHILRGADNKTYYMVATDMVSARGWNSNRAMILMKSTNLTSWQTSVVNIQKTFPGYEALQRVWAPQTIYNSENGKYMVYWSMKVGNEPDKIYYAYANDEFNALETAPALLFANPDGGACIDADIVEKDGVYHLFYKTEGDGNGIKKAICSTLTGEYAMMDKYLQSTTNAVEGGCVFRMYDTDNWLLIYDMYMNDAYQFTKSTDLMNFSVVTSPVVFDFTPRHGTIIPITSEEANALMAKWDAAMGTSVKAPASDVISTEYYTIDGKRVKKKKRQIKGCSSKGPFMTMGRGAQER